MRAVLREVRSRFWALAALAVVVAVAAGLAAAFVTAWGSGLPWGARQDLLASSADAVSISRPVDGAADDAASNRSVQAALARVAPAGSWRIESVSTSDVFDLSAGVVDGAVEQTYAVSSNGVQQNAVLVAGAWPSYSPGAAVGVALPASALQALGLWVGDRLALDDAVDHSVVEFVVTGSFRYVVSVPAALAWNQIGASGVESDGSSTYFGPLVADPAAFAAGALPTAGGSWVLTPTGADLDAAALTAQASALKDSAELAPQNGYTVASGLPALVAGISARLAAGRAQLLAGAILVGMLAGVALVSSVGSLVARGGMQAALLSSRGAPRRTNVSFYATDVVVAFLFAAAGVLTQQVCWGHSLGAGSGTPFAAWASGFAVALVAGLMLCVRAARVVDPAEFAAASGRQSTKPAIIRVGGDLALIVLAGVAVWQAGEVGLSARSADGGGVAPVLIVAAAPALAVAAGAALCGRLVVGAARLFEFVARRARSAPLRLATWELARTPLRYLVPALLCVAAVGGCGSLAAQHASWLRSAHDQAAFTQGAQVTVTLQQMLPLGQAGSVGSAPGVLAATPVAEVDIGSGTLIALDARNAASAVSLRPDLAGESATRLWGGLLPAAACEAADTADTTAAGSAGTGAGTGAGICVPGRPTTLGLTGTLTGAGRAAVEVDLTVQDAAGLTYSIPVGQLAPDAAQHSLSAQIAPHAGADYPLRVIGVTLQPTDSDLHASSATSSYKFTVSGLTERLAGGAVTSFAGAVALSTWTRGILPPDTVSMTPALASSLVLPAFATRAYLTANGEHVGSTDHVTVNGVPVAVRIVASVAAFPGLSAGNANALVVDLAALADAVNAGGAQLWPTATWWLRTADGTVPAALPAGTVVTTTSAAQAALTADPLSAIPQRVLGIAGPALVLLAVLGLVISLLAASRDAAHRDTVLSALGTTRAQLAALTCLLQACVVVPAALLGAGLGFLLARVFTPVLVLGADGAPPQPSAVVLLDAPWSVAAVLIVVVATVAAGLAIGLLRQGRLTLAGSGSGSGAGSGS